MDSEQRLTEMIDEELMVLGYELVKLELSLLGRRKIVRIYIDRPGSGISLDDCIEVTKALGLALDGDECFSGPYNLEVSSPGINRPLTKPRHFERFEGKKAKVQYLDDEGSRATIIGEIRDPDSTGVTIVSGGSGVRVEHDRITKANLHGEEWEIPKRHQDGRPK